MRSHTKRNVASVGRIQGSVAAVPAGVPSNADMVCSSVAVLSQRAPLLEAFHYQEVEAATHGFAADHLVGRGSHACVYRANLRGVKRAVKRASAAGGAGSLLAMDNELEVLSKIRHRRVVNLVGVCIGPDKEKILVVELLTNGTLHDALHELKRDGGTPGWPLRVRLALHTAQGLLALHSASPPVLHRDIKSTNILLDSKWNAKIGDFGLALRGRMDEIGRKRAPPAGTMGYLDPEYESPGRLSPKIDVFSFGILLLEILSGRQAIDVNFHPSSIIDWALPLIKRGKAADVLDPRLPELGDNNIAKQLAATAARCVRSNGVNRPNMSAVVEQLQHASVNLPLPKSVKKWFVEVSSRARIEKPVKVAEVKSRPPLKESDGVQATKAYNNAKDEDDALVGMGSKKASGWKGAHCFGLTFINRICP